MKWKKLGKIFCPQAEYPWMQSHATLPLAEHLQQNIFKIYFSSRDEFNRSYTNFITIDITDPHKILNLSSKPILSPGKLGCFDDSGTMASWITKVHDKNYLYYIGWNLGVTVPFRNAIGLALQQDEIFQRYCEGPIVDRSMHEPYFCASCCVLPDTTTWRMWYLSCTNWSDENSEIKHHYHIKYAESVDGISWQRDGIVAIDFLYPDEFAISRPSVLRDDNLWKMWYSYRGESYRIGYAESLDGKKWQRLDHLVGIDVSNSDWDSIMIAYPFVFDHNGSRYMLYNGNDYGRSGFGLAILE